MFFHRFIISSAMALVLIVSSIALADFEPQQVVTLDGKSVTIGNAGEKPQLVFVMATRCPNGLFRSTKNTAKSFVSADLIRMKPKTMTKLSNIPRRMDLSFQFIAIHRTKS